MYAGKWGFLCVFKGNNKGDRNAMCILHNKKRISKTKQIKLNNERKKCPLI
jgi:hypothetical protein